MYAKSTVSPLSVVPGNAGSESLQPYLHYNLEMEEAMMGLFSLVHNSVGRVRKLLKPEMFYSRFFGELFQVYLDMFDAGLQTDLLSVTSLIMRLPDKHPIWQWCARQEVPFRLAKTQTAVVNDTSMIQWALILQDLYIERELFLIQHGGFGLDDGLSTRQKLFQFQKKIDELVQNRGDGDEWSSIDSVLIRLLGHMNVVKDMDIPGVPFGFKRFDYLTGGLAPGLYYLAARPGVGKTALAMKVILNMAALGVPSGIISLEMPELQLAARMLSITSGQQFSMIFRGKILNRPEGPEQLYPYIQAMGELPIYVADKTAVGMADIRAKYYKLRETWTEIIRKKTIEIHGNDGNWQKKVPIHLLKPILWIDYLQLIEAEENKNKNREQEVAKISRGLKMLSREEDIPIVALAQLNRQSEQRADKRPRLSDLRESGSIEQDADGVMILHSPWSSGIKTFDDSFGDELKDRQGMTTEGYTEVNVAKWRNGAIFTHELFFDGKRMEFTEPDFDSAF